jgi:ribonuclease-3
MKQFPALHEGELSVMRAQIVNEHSLAEVAATLGLGDWLFLGRGEEHTGGRKKPSLLADACEAVIGAVFLDGGFGAAFALVDRLLGARLAGKGLTDHKTRLQERAQATLRETPRYSVVGESGPDHDKTFEVAVLVGGKELARGGGKSKKEAEQRAAAAALEIMSPSSEPPAS